MDHVLGLVGKDFVLIAADMKVAHSVLTMKSDQDKCVHLDVEILYQTDLIVCSFSIVAFSSFYTCQTLGDG